MHVVDQQVEKMHIDSFFYNKVEVCNRFFALSSDCV